MLTAVISPPKPYRAAPINIPAWVPIIGGKDWGFDFKEIPKLEKGGDIMEAGRVLVGERGPEELLLPRGAQVRPLSESATNQYTFESGAFVLEAKELKDIQTIQEFFDRIRLSQRLAGGEA